MDILDRDAAPLSEHEWQQINSAVISSARDTLVGRRVIEALGPLGSGIYSLPYSVFSGNIPVGIDLTGDDDKFVIEATKRKTIDLPILYQDFKLMWRNIESDRKLGLPFDTSAAAVTARLVAAQEDNLIFNGNPELGLEGLLTASGRQTAKIGNWEDPGQALSDVSSAVNLLQQAGYNGPYALITSTNLYGYLIRAYPHTGYFEIQQIEALIGDGIYHTAAISPNKAIVLATGGQNTSLAIGQDLITGYLGPVNMNHLFRVMETIALLIRRPDSICTIE